MSGPRRRNIKTGTMSSSHKDEQRPLLQQQQPEPDRPTSSSTSSSVEVMMTTQWITLSLASGACAAFNGVFAKLTTTEMTSNLAGNLAETIGLTRGNKLVELVLRGIFFALNLAFNGVMWGLFTTALARATSSTKVSVVNTSCNFMISGVLGFLIFGERLPPLWWLGAALLVAGNVIIGRRDEEEEKRSGGDGGGGDSLPGIVQEGGSMVEEVPLIDVEEEEEEDDDVVTTVS